MVTIVTIIISMKRKHGQHFLLSAKARTFSLMQIFRLSDDQAFAMFKEARWGDDDPSCPKCGNQDHYWLKTRSQWRCKSCNHSFSVTSGTIFANHKMPLRNYLAAIAIYTNAVKGISALQLSRDLDCQYKTAFVLAHKLRETLVDENPGQLEGEVEMDGAYVNKHVRPRNNRTDRIDRRLKENQNPNKRAVIVLRQRGEKGEGAIKTLTFLAKTENQQSTIKLAKDFIKKGSTIYADEHKAYDILHANLVTHRVVHAEHYCGPNGENTNQAESFFSRLRRMQYGQIHKMDNTYADRYSNEAAYREDNRRMDNGSMFADIMNRCAASTPSRDFAGYWQGNKRLGENLA